MKKQKQKEREELVEKFLNSTRPPGQKNDNQTKSKGEGEENGKKMPMEHFGDDSVEGYDKPKKEEKHKAKGKTKNFSLFCFFKEDGRMDNLGHRNFPEKKIQLSSDAF